MIHRDEEGRLVNEPWRSMLHGDGMSVDPPDPRYAVLPTQRYAQDQPSIGDQCAEAYEEAAQKKVESLRLEKLRARIWDRIFLSTEGKNIAEREAKARQHVDHLTAEDAAISAESEAIIAKSRANGLEIRFQEWQSINATAREQMKLR